MDVDSTIEAELENSKERILSILNRSRSMGPGGSFNHSLDTVFLESDDEIDTFSVLPDSRQTPMPGGLVAMRRKEIKAAISSFEARLNQDYELGLVLESFPEVPPIRLRVVSFYISGSVSFIGVDNSGLPVNLYDRLDKLSLVLKKIRRRSTKVRRKPVRFFRVTPPAPEH